MKIAVAGKGGAGKTTFCATASRLIARAGHSVIAIDGDSNPNLHAAMTGAAPPDKAADLLPASLVTRRFTGPALTQPIDDVLDSYGLAVADGVRLLQMGSPDHADEGCLCAAHATVSALLADLEARRDMVTILDLEASPEHLSRGTARNAHVLVLMAEPYFRSLEAVRLQAVLAAEMAIEHVVVVANKLRTASDRAGVAEFCERHDHCLIGAIPWSESAVDADAASTPLLDHDPNGAAVGAIAEVAEALVQLPIRAADGVDA